MADHTKLAGDQKFVQDRLLKLIRNPRKADALYNAIPDSQRGKIVSVDIARFLAPEFGTWDGRVRHTPSTSQPAGEYAHQRILRGINGGKPNSILLITAGTAGAGKTSALKLGRSGSIADDSDLVLDNQMRYFDRANHIIDLALGKHWRVRLLYVFRPFDELARAVAERSLRTGRWNRLSDLPLAHIECRETALRLIMKYSTYSRFACTGIVNAIGPGEIDRTFELDADDTEDFLSHKAFAKGNRHKLLREYEAYLTYFIGKGPGHLSNVEAAKEKFKEFFRLIG